MKSRTVAYIVLAVTIVFAIAPAYRGQIELPVRVHHLLHAMVLVLAAFTGLLFARSAAPAKGSRAFWLIVTIVAPMLAMFLMWPSNYSPLDRLPAAHTAEHLGLALLGFLTAYAGQQYATGVGVAMSLSLWAMAFLAAWGFGVSPPLQVQTAAAAPTAAAAANAGTAPDPHHGQAVFSQNCASCHGAQGQGGMGPRLIGESSRKDLMQAEAWIENPQPPMPKLYPGTLSAQDVRDVAAYVETLK
jgi:mono/diheme cytochrome c family protein